MAQNGVAEKTGTVWVVFPVSRNLEDARRYGELKYLFQRQIQMREKDQEQSDNIGLSLTRTISASFEPAYDYLLLVGSTLLLAMTIAAMQELFGSFNTLHYDLRTMKYVAVRIDAETWSSRTY